MDHALISSDNGNSFRTLDELTPEQLPRIVEQVASLLTVEECESIHGDHATDVAWLDAACRLLHSVHGEWPVIG